MPPKSQWTNNNNNNNNNNSNNNNNNNSKSIECNDIYMKLPLGLYNMILDILSNQSDKLQLDFENCKY